MNNLRKEKVLENECVYLIDINFFSSLFDPINQLSVCLSIFSSVRLQRIVITANQCSVKQISAMQGIGNTKHSIGNTKHSIGTVL
jgi:hypothetical protein